MFRFTPQDTGYMLFALDKSAHDPKPEDDVGSPIPCWRTPQPETHQHEDHEINIIVDGCTLYVWDDPVTGDPVRATVASGEVLAIPGGVNHIVYVERKAIVQGMWIHPSVLGKRMVDPRTRPNIVADPHLFADLRGLFDRSEAETSKPDSFSREALVALGKVAGITLLRTLSARSAPSSDSASLRIKEVWAWLDRNFLKCPSVSDLAHRAGLGKTQFTLAFRKEVGTTPAAYGLKLRLNHAMDLLAHTDLSISSIATTCGFTSASEFNRAFRRVSLETPSGYRTKCQDIRSSG